MKTYFKDKSVKLTPELIKKLLEENSNLPSIDDDDEDNYACEAYTPAGAPPIGMPTGWVCPKCGAVMSPYQSYCVKCSGNWEITFNTGTFLGTPNTIECNGGNN